VKLALDPYTQFVGTLGRPRFDGIMTVCVFACEDRAKASSVVMREEIATRTAGR